MSAFAVYVVRVAIEPHENADALELARVGDYLSVVRKGQFQSGDLVAYIPEQSLLPAALLDELGLRGKLAGKDGDRVKAIKLRGVLSQGLVYPARPDWSVGQDVAGELGVRKWEPPAPPAHMNGVCYAAGLDRCMRYDIENFKAYPEVLLPGEAVVFTEKIHGTWAQIGYLPPGMIETQGHLVVSSKGLAAKGLAFIPDAPDNASNLYLRVARGLEVDRRISEAFVAELAADQPIFVLGEVFGAGVQDLGYGAKADASGALGFRVFDIHVGRPGQGHYLGDEALERACAALGLPRVPVVFRGPFTREAMLAHTDGKESVTGKALHIREGIVVRPTVERRDPRLGRVQLKSVSEKYLLRSGGTEYN
jgi:RNA ligase (TIGR02306 family)